MATLYELTAEYQNLLDMAADDSVDPEVLADTMEAIGGEIEEKADGYAMVMRELGGQVELLKAEIDRLTARKRAIENNIAGMKKTLENAMCAVGKTKFKTNLFSFGIQNNPPSVIMDEQELGNIPTEYLIEQDPKIDRKKILEDLKAGVENARCIAHIEQKQSLRIR